METTSFDDSWAWEMASKVFEVGTGRDGDMYTSRSSTVEPTNPCRIRNREDAVLCIVTRTPPHIYLLCNAVLAPLHAL